MSFEIMAPGKAQTKDLDNIDLYLGKSALPDDLKNKITTNMKFSDLINLCKAVRFKNDWCNEPKLKEYIFDVQKSVPVHVEGPEDQIVIEHRSLSINKGIEKYISEFNNVMGKYNKYYYESEKEQKNKFGYWSAIFFCIEVYRRPLLWKVIPELFQKMFLETYDEVTKNDAVGYFIMSKNITFPETENGIFKILNNPERNPFGLILAASAMIKMVNDIFYDFEQDLVGWRTDDKTVQISFFFCIDIEMIELIWCDLSINFSLNNDYSFETLSFNFSASGFDEKHQNELCRMFEGQGGEGNKFKHIHIHDTVDFAKPYHIEHKNVKVNVSANENDDVFDVGSDFDVKDEKLKNDAVQKFFKKLEDIKRKVMSANAPLMLIHQLPSMSHVLDKMTRRFE